MSQNVTNCACLVFISESRFSFIQNNIFINKAFYGINRLVHHLWWTARHPHGKIIKFLIADLDPLSIERKKDKKRCDCNAFVSVREWGFLITR